jgi:hypothetical protein
MRQMDSWSYSFKCKVLESWGGLVSIGGFGKEEGRSWGIHFEILDLGFEDWGLGADDYFVGFPASAAVDDR